MVKKYNFRHYNHNLRALRIIEEYESRLVARYRFASYIVGLGQEKYEGLRKKLFVRLLKGSFNQGTVSQMDLRTYPVGLRARKNRDTRSKKWLRQIIKKINREAKNEVIRQINQNDVTVRTPKKGYYISFFDLGFIGDPRIEFFREKFDKAVPKLALDSILRNIGEVYSDQHYIESITNVLNDDLCSKYLAKKMNNPSKEDLKRFQAYLLVDCMDDLELGLLTAIYKDKAKFIYKHKNKRWINEDIF